MIRILALDTGTANTGWSLLQCDLATSTVRIIEFGLIRTEKWEKDGTEANIRDRIDEIGGLYTLLINRLKPDYIAIEDFIEQGKFVGKTYKEMAFLTEHLRVVGKSNGYDVIIFENGFWKKTIMKATRANKQQVQHFITHAIPESATLLRKAKDHVWDSVGVGYCLYTLLAKGEFIHDYRSRTY